MRSQNRYEWCRLNNGSSCAVLRITVEATAFVASRRVLMEGFDCCSSTTPTRRLSDGNFDGGCNLNLAAVVIRRPFVTERYHDTSILPM
ncbi:MAG: hypothetical protein QM516_00835 [Limnohabitans sp.]|nr:hypothetical protein [Limnohabitans sp.]